MKCLVVRLLLCLLLLQCSARAADVVISEIMYDAPSHDPGEEFIELYNRGSNIVSLAGWRFTKGVSYTFSNNITLGPRQYLVVAANRVAFQLKYPGVTNVVSDWLGQLSNRDEEIELENAAGEVVNNVHYASEGDWAQRVRGPDDRSTRGWDWLALHDGLGPSVELIQPGLPNASGQNWAPSASGGGTPGGANSVSATNIAPLILDVTHFPVVPRSTQSITITARLLDEGTAGLTVILSNRNHSTLTPPNFSGVTMFDDGQHNDGASGDGIYGASLSPQANLAVIEFFVFARDAQGRTRTWPAPALDEFGVPGQLANALLQVDDGATANPQPTVRLLMTETERRALQNINRQSDAAMNTTIVSLDGVDTKIRYLASQRIRGAGSRSRTPPNYRVDVPNDHRWNGVSAFNLNTQHPWLQVFGSALAQKSGLAVLNARGVQVRVNAANLANAQPTPGNPATFQYGLYSLTEVYDPDWSARHFPRDPNGNIYRASTGAHSADLTHEGPDPASYVSQGYSKASNQSENDWSDLTNLTYVLSFTPDQEYTAAVNAVADVREWMRYFAVLALMEYSETALGSGAGDDYAMYRGLVDTNFLIIAHDFDTIFGQGDAGGNVNENIFIAANASSVVDRFIKWPEFVPIYFEELTRLINTTFSQAEFDPLLDNTLRGWVPDTVLTQMKQFARSRITGVLAQIPQRLRVTTMFNTLTNGYPYVPVSSIFLAGQANPTVTRSVRVNGLDATWTAWQGTWSIAPLPLNPGLNRLLLQAFDANGAEVARDYFDIYSDASSGTDIAADVSTDTTWTAAASPYVLRTSVNVTGGATLTLEPGVTVLAEPGVGLSVAGRLVAVGEDTNRIRFARALTAGNRTNSWRGITLNGATGTNRLSYVDIDGAGSAGACLHLLETALVADHLAFTNTTETLIELNDSSLHVRDSYFPSIVAHELIHGGPVPAGGFVVIESNWFGSSTALNDIIDFTGARRPDRVLQILNNAFTGSSDDVLDLDGTDAHIEGNIFMRVHKNNPNVGDTSSAISYGADAGYAPHVVAVRNLFFDVDHVALCKEGGFLTLVNNTALGVNIAAINFSEPERNTVPGGGAFLDGNIFWNPPGYAGTNFQNRFPTNGAVQLTAHRNIFAATDGLTNGVGNFMEDPRLANTNASTITLRTVASDFALGPGSPARGTGPNGLDRGALVPGGASISGEPVSPTTLANATLTVGGPGIVTYRASLDGAAFGSETSVSNTIVLTSLADGAHSVRVLGRNSAGVWQTVPTQSRAWTVSAVLPGHVRLNELLARNNSAVPHAGTFPDLIELFNEGGAPVNLGGWGLTDDAGDKYRFTFPSNTVLNAGQYLVVIAEEPNGTPGLHAGFSLNQNGGTVSLFARPAEGGALLDAVTYGLQLPDLSIGRVGGSWTLTRPTLGAANVAQPLGDPQRLYLNEWLADGGTVFDDDYIEIYNSDSLPVALGGLHLSEQPVTDPGQHTVVDLSFIAAYGYTLLIADGSTDRGADHLSFSLSPDQGFIGLTAPDFSMLDCVAYGPQDAAVSEGRRPNAGTLITKFGAATEAQPTPNGPNPGFGASTTITNLSTVILPLTATWRYNVDGLDLGLAWRGLGYSDAAWSNGPALLAEEDCNCLPTPGINTRLPLTLPGSSARLTNYYFRTRFVVTTNLRGAPLTGRLVLDDGAVFYINGLEAGRLRMPNGGINAAVQANVSVGNAVLETISLPSTNVIVGTNLIAVEVHQNNIPSSDVVFGLGLETVQFFTNTVEVPLVLNEVLARSAALVPPGSTNAVDWVELRNRGSNTIDLSDMSLSDSASQPRRWVFPAGVSLPAGSHLLVLCDGSQPASTNAGGTLHTGFSLDGNGDEVFLVEAPARGGAVVDSITFGPQAADFAIGRDPLNNVSWVLTVPTPGGANIVASLGDRAAVRFNEWLANPAGGNNDFFELFNPGPQPVSLGGLYLTDVLANKTKHRIADLSFLGVGAAGFLEFIADGDVQDGRNHVNFALSNNGEALGLFTQDGTAIDSLTFGAQENGVSEGRFPDGSTNVARFRGTSTPGASNLLPLESVVINEVLTHTDLPLEDAIELFNPTYGAVDLSGWYLSDEASDPKKFRIPDHTVLPPRGYVVFYEYQFNPDSSGRSPSFALSSANGDQVHLYTADAAGNLTGYRTSVDFGPQRNGVSFGRYLTSVGPDFTAMATITVGASTSNTVEIFRTGLGAANSMPRVSSVILTEIMYHPPDVITATETNDDSFHEFIELYNVSGAPASLFDTNHPAHTWRLRDAVDFDFPTNVTLPVRGFALVVNFDPATNAGVTAAFRAYYNIPSAVPLFGPYQGKLGNDGENVELYYPDEPQPGGEVPYVLAERVRYSDDGLWPAGADGNTNGIGYSLQRLRDGGPQFVPYGNEPASWFAGPPTAGTNGAPPATDPPSIISFIAPLWVLPGSNTTLTAIATGAAPLRYQWVRNGLSLAGATNTSLAVNNFGAADIGTYAVIVSNPGGITSASAFVALNAPPMITAQPQDTVTAPGSTATLQVLAQGSPTLTYEWFKNGVPANDFDPLLTLSNVQLADEGNYFVVVRNTYGAVTSSVVTLTISLAPVILQQPQSTNVFTGASVAFEVVATGSAPLSYQWRYNNNPIPTATAALLTIANVQVFHSGLYSVLVSNSVGTVVSTSATLVVTVPPLVTVQAFDAVASEPGANTGAFLFSRTGSTALPLSVDFTVGGTATAGMDYSSLGNSLVIGAGASSAVLTVTPQNDAELESAETVVVTVGAGATYVVGVPSSATVTILDDDNAAPTVNLTSPAAGSVFHAPTNVTLAATTLDSDGSVGLVEFFSGTNRVGRSTGPAFEATWTNAPVGTHVLTAVASDNFGATGTSTPVTVVINARPVVNITAPAHGTAYVFPATFAFSVNAGDSDGAVTQVEFYEGAHLLGLDSTSPFSISVMGLPLGTYVLTARATDNRGAVTVSTPVTILINATGSGFGDDLAQRGTISGYTNYVLGTNTAYTREINEPRHANRLGVHSGWLSWTAPASGTVTLDTLNSDFDTVLAVYTNLPGASLVVSNLAPVASNDDSTNPVALQSKLSFAARSGTTYFIAVDGYDQTEYGLIALRLNLPNLDPLIVTQPLSQTVNPGANVSFVVAATGPGALSYQWQFNGAGIVGATTTNLILTNVSPAQAGAYTVLVSNTNGSTMSQPALLTVRTPPTILAQPQNRVVDPGSNATFSVTAGGLGPYTFQWRFNGGSIVGATSSTYTRNATLPTHGGIYSVTVTGPGGVTNSSGAELIVRPRLVEAQRVGGSLQFTLQGTPGRGYGLEKSPRLPATNWISVSTVTNVAVSASVSDPNPGSPPEGVYRLRVLQ